MLLVAIGLLFGLVVLLGCFVLSLVQRDTTWERRETVAECKGRPVVHSRAA